MDYTRFLASSREDRYPNHIQFSLPNLQTRLEQATLFEKLKTNFNADFIEPSAFLNLSHQEDNTVRNPDDFLLPDSHAQGQLSPMDNYAQHYFQTFRSQGPNLFQLDGIKDSQDYLGSMDIDFWGSNEDPQAMQTDSEMMKNMECSNSVSANSQSDAPLQIPSLVIPALETHSPIKDRNRLRANSMLSESTIACDNILCHSPVELCNQRRKSQTTQSKSKKKKELEVCNGNQNSTGMSPPYLKLKKSKSEFDSSIFPSNAGINMLSYYAELRCSQGNEMLYNNPFVSYTPNYFDRSAEKDERNENSTDISSCISTHPPLEDPNNLMNNTYPTTLPFLNQTQSTYSASYDMGERLSFPPDNMDFFSNSTPLIRTHGPVIKKIGPLTVEERQAKIDKYLQKRKQRSWNKKISYDCRKRVADGRLRIRGRFVTKSHAFAILEADGVAYDPNKITMAEIKEYLTKKFMDHPHIDEHEKLKQFEDEYFKFERKEEDGEGELYYDLNEEFGMSPLGSDDGKCGFPYN